MRLLLYLGVIIYLFLTTSTAAFIGVQQVGTLSSIILIFIFLFNYLSSDGKTFFNKNFTEEINVIKVCIGILFIRVILGDYPGSSQVLFFLIVPIMVSMVIAVYPPKDRIIVKNLVLALFFLECFLAIYERVFSINIFPYTDESLDSSIAIEGWLLRSSAFFGHPLMNALVVTTITGFILCSNYNNKFKSICLTLGFIALLCFNARGAVLVSCLVSIIYFVGIIKESKKLSLALIITIVVVVGGIAYLTLNTNLGGRLAHQDKVLDESAQSRFAVYSAFNYISNTDFLWGNPTNASRIIKILNSGGIENSFVVIIINYGLVMSLILTYYMYFLFKKSLAGYTRINKIIILISFLLVGSLNNSLAAPSAWIIIFICFKVFLPKQFLSSIIDDNRRVVNDINVGSNAKRRDISLL